MIHYNADGSPLFPKTLTLILLLAVSVRIIFVVVFADLSHQEYWEYGEIGRNLLEGKGYSLFFFQNENLVLRYSPDSSPFPTAYMLPGYVAFLVPFLLIDDIALRSTLIIIIHIAVSMVLLTALYHFTKKYFSERIAGLATLIAAVLPDFVYSVVSFTPVIFFQFGLVLIFIRLFRGETSHRSSVALGLMSAVMIYFRPEFILFAAFIIFTRSVKKRWREACIVMGVILMLLTPWVLRNWLVFDSFIPLSTSGGLNFFRGNNPDVIGAWGDETTNQLTKLLPRDHRFEVHFNALFFNKTIAYINESPLRAALEVPEKLFDLWLFNRHDARVSLLYSLYSILFTAFFAVGVYRTFSLKYLWLYLFFLYFTLIVTLFFCLPRYQTIMRIGMLPFVAVGFDFIVDTFTTKFRKSL